MLLLIIGFCYIFSISLMFASLYSREKSREGILSFEDICICVYNILYAHISYRKMHSGI